MSRAYLKERGDGDKEIMHITKITKIWKSLFKLIYSPCYFHLLFLFAVYILITINRGPLMTWGGVDVKNLQLLPQNEQNYTRLWYCFSKCVAFTFGVWMDIFLIWSSSFWYRNGNSSFKLHSKIFSDIWVKIL